MTSAGAKLSVIVVTYNSAPWIEACLCSVFAQQVQGLEVIVVDHESRDDTVTIVRSKFPRARLFEAPNRGFGAGCNRGANEARAPVLAFLNPDAVAEPGWLANLVESLSDPSTIVTSQIVLLDDPSRINTLGHELHFTGFGYVIGYRNPRSAETKPREVPGFSGAAFAMRREDFENLGGFDENIFLYQDDTELSWRARRHGFRILLVPNSVARHRYTFRLDAEKLYHVERGRRIILRKHVGRGQKVRWSPSLWLARAAMRVAALRFGRAGWRAIGRAAREARRVSIPPAPAGAIELQTFLSRHLAFEAMVESRAGKIGGAFLNLIFRINTILWRRPWKSRKGEASG